MNSLVQRQMILWTLGLVMVFGVAVGFTLLEPPTTLSIVKPERSALEREPASIAPIAEVPTAIALDSEAQVSDYRVNCDQDSLTTLASSIQQVRLRGETCLPKKKLKIQSTQIKNVTNGFIATVFTPDDSRFSTDYINLRKGENNIEIDMIFSDGTHIARKLKFTRQ